MIMKKMRMIEQVTVGTVQIVKAIRDYEARWKRCQ
jgi:hypothetical protein